MKKKLLWLSDSPTTPTGYANITRNILNRLSKKYDCHSIGHNYHGMPLEPPIQIKNSKPLKFNLHGAGKAKYSMDILTPIIRGESIDIFGILLDTFMCYDAGFMNIDTSPAKTFFYFPSDGGGGLPFNCENILKKVNYPIAMSKFGQLQSLKKYGIKSHYIPHGVNTNLFKPYSKKKKEKLKQDWGLQDKFIVGTVARNQSRKMMDRTIKAFALFCRDKPDAILLMHTDPTDMAASYDLRELITRFKLNNRIIFTGATFFNPFTNEKMVDVYNLMDVFFLSTSGEGFGIPIIEAMSCGVPQVATDYTTSKELIMTGLKSGEVAKLCGEDNYAPYPHTDEALDGTLTGSWNVERGIISIKDAAHKLEILYNNQKNNSDMWKTYVFNSREKAIKEYDWKLIIKMWEEFLGGI